jgi:hypothetical protein
LVSLIDYVVVTGGWLFDDDTSVLLIFYTLVRFLTPEVMADGSIVYLSLKVVLRSSRE